MRESKASHPDAPELNHESYVVGCKYFDAGKYRQALSAFRKSLEYWPEDPDAWMAVGNCWTELKRSVQAEMAYRLALKYAQKKDKNPITYNLANSLFDQAQYNEAITMYRSIEPGTEVWRLAQLNIKRAEKKL